MNNTYLLPLFLSGIAIIILLIAFTVIMVLIQKQKQNRYAREKQQAENDKLKARIEAQEKSMSLISRELHDSIGQVLGTVKFELYTVGATCSDPKSKQTILECNHLIDQTIIDIRNISHSLNSDLIRRIGLIQAISKEIEQLKNRKRIRAALQISGEDGYLSGEQELMVFRIFQEALKNTLKHAGASQLSVIMDCSPTLFLIEIADNGRGFNPENTRIDSIGLANMYERAKALNASLVVSSAPLSGCTVRLNLPLKQAI